MATNELTRGAPNELDALYVAATDEATTISRSIRSVHALGNVVVTLPTDHAPGQRHNLVASGGSITIQTSDGVPILNGTFVPAGSRAVVEFAFLTSLQTFAWIVMGSGGGIGTGEILVKKIIDVYNLNNLSLPRGIYARPVESVDQPFELLPDSTVPANGITVVNALSTGAGPAGVTALPGRWVRNVVPVARWTIEPIWRISNLTGDDENTGRPGFPLKTLAELCRRIVRWRFTQTAAFYYDIQHLDADIPASDVWRPTGDADTAEATTNQVYSWLLRGTRFPYLSASVASAASAVPATNTRPRFNGGATFLPAIDTTLIGKMIVIPNGIGNGLDVVAWIQRAGAGPNDAFVSDWVTVNPATINPAVAVLTAAQAAALAGKPYQVVDTTRFNTSMMSNGVFLDRQRYMDLTFPTAALEEVSLRDVTGNLITCRIQQRIGAAAGGAVILNACGIDFPALTDYSTLIGGSSLALIGSSVRNVSLTLGPVATLFTVNAIIDGGFIEANVLTTQQSQTANFVANGFAGGSWVCQAQTGIFNSPKSGVIIKRGAQAQISAALYGGGADGQNAGFGLESLEDGGVFVLATQTPTITGASGDLQVDGSPTAVPNVADLSGGAQAGASVLAAGVSAAIPATITPSSRITALVKDPAGGASPGNAVLFAPAGDRVLGTPGSFKVHAADGASTSTFDWHVEQQPVPLNTWVQWAGTLITDGFARNVVSGKTGAKIVSVGTT